jgi:hypothetical protein
MAEKKWQHYVPQVYLKLFTDTDPPSGWPTERPFEPVVWIAQPRALDSFRRKAPVNILASNRLYNLRSDDPHRPWLEESFGRLETHYERVLGVLQVQQDLGDDLYGMLILFIAALSARTPGSIDHRQAIVDDLERIHRMVVSGDAPAEADADRLFTDSDEAGRRLIPEWAQAYAEVVGPTGFIIVNQSAMEFITSDRPVSHLFLHVDERPIASFPVSLRASVKPNVQAHFSLTPLTPQLAFVSSPLLKSGDFYFKTTDLALIFSLNQLTRAMAKNWIIASGPRPYGDLTEAVMAAERSNIAREQVDGLLIYTDESRYWISSTDVVHSNGSHPLIGRLSFTTQDCAVLQQIAEDGCIHEVTVYSEGHAVSHLKHARLVQLAGSPIEISIIETNLQDLASAWPA